MQFKIEKTDRIDGTVKAPPSKSYTHRAFFLAALANGKSKLQSPLYSEDTLASLVTCHTFGSEFDVSDEECTIEGTGGELKTPLDVLDLKNSGTTLRIATTMAGLASGCTVLTGDDSLRTRPMQPLLDSLKKLKVTAYSTRNNGNAPLVIKNGFQGGSTSIRGDVSSQYISSILISAPYAVNPVEVTVTGDFISRPYVEMTRDIMEKFGVKAQLEDNTFHIEQQTYKSREYTIEGDYSSASYLIAAAAILDSDITIENLFKDSQQGDKIILDIVQEMGAQVKSKKNMVTITGGGDLQGVTVNLEDSPDLVPTVAVLGALSRGETIITGVEHARFKETDRLSTTAQELKKMGVDIVEKVDGLIINGNKDIQGAMVESHNDHRLAMALSLVGLKTGNVYVKNAQVHQISFPGFVGVMEKLGCKIEALK